MLDSAYEQLLGASILAGMPHAFTTDLTTHDKRALGRDDAPDRFGWVLYPCGTHLIDPGMTTASLNGYIEHLLSPDYWANGMTGKKARFFLFEKGRLHLVGRNVFCAQLRCWNADQ